MIVSEVERLSREARPSKSTSIKARIVLGRRHSITMLGIRRRIHGG